MDRNLLLTWVEDSPLRGVVKVHGSRGTLAPLGGEVTLYRFGSHFDPIYDRHPVSIHGFFRIRFGSHTGTGQTSPIGHSIST